MGAIKNLIFRMKKFIATICEPFIVTGEEVVAYKRFTFRVYTDVAGGILFVAYDGQGLTYGHNQGWDAKITPLSDHLSPVIGTQAYNIKAVPSLINYKYPFTFRSIGVPVNVYLEEELIDYVPAVYPNSSLYLVDEVLGINHDLRAGFTLNLPTGIYENRFYLTMVVL